MTKAIPQFSTPNFEVNDCGVFMLFSKEITTPIATMENSTVPKNNGNSDNCPNGSRCEIDGVSMKAKPEIMPTAANENYIFNVTCLPTKWLNLIDLMQT